MKRMILSLLLIFLFSVSCSKEEPAIDVSDKIHHKVENIQ